MEFQYLQTDRLLLRMITPEVMQYLFDNLSDEELKKEFGKTTDEALQLEKDKFKGGYTGYKRSILLFQLMLKDSSEVIGNCGFHNWYLDHRRAELGYWLLDDQYKRQGYMGEALVKVIEYGFEVMNLNRIEAFIAPGNKPSLKLIKKSSFVQEGYLREHYFSNNKLEDSLLFALLKNDYNAPGKL